VNSINTHASGITHIHTQMNMNSVSGKIHFSLALYICYKAIKII